jgi:hypothetical protein
MANLYRDDNGAPLATAQGFRPLFTAAGVEAAATGAAVAELDISALNASAVRNASGNILIRVACIGSNACYFALGAAGASGSFTSANMIILAPNSVEYFKANSTDVSAYHQQITGSSTLQVALVQ